MGFIDFTTGQVLTADQMDLVMRQTVMRFADAATRDTALTGVLAEGMIAYLDDTNEVLKYNGTAWVAIDPEIITTQGDIIVGDATGDASRLALGTAGQILESNGTALSYVTPDSSPDDIITTQGDLIIGGVSGDAVRLPVGAADTVLTSDGTTLSFAAAGGGGGMTEIASGSLAGSTVSITSIPQTFKALQLDIIGASTSGNDDPRFTLNNNTGTNYINLRLATGTNPAQFTGPSGVIFAADLLSGFGNAKLEIPQYTSAEETIPVQVTSSIVDNSDIVKSLFNQIAFRAGSVAITSLEIKTNFTFDRGTYILYGVS